MADSASSPSTVAASAETRAHGTLFHFALGLIAANVVVQLILVLAGHRVTGLTTIPLAVLALGYAAYLLAVGRALGRVRYGHLVSHALTYVTVNLGYHLHGWMLIGSSSPAIQGDGPLALDTGWLGALFAMPVLWGLGLLVHSLAALHQRGFEATRP